MWSIHHSCQILIKFDFSGHIFETFMTVCLVESELLRDDRQTFEANSRFFADFANTLKNQSVIYYYT
jgi:hypothetical protein